jgi:hypothetical protein
MALLPANQGLPEKLKVILSQNKLDIIQIWYSILLDFSVFYFKI